MDRTVGMILEMTAVALLVVFLLAYLLGGSSAGGIGIWGIMGTVESKEEQAPSYEVEAFTEEVLAAPVYEICCNPGCVYVNRSYELWSLFAKEEAADSYLELEEIYLGEERVLARGDVDLLFEEESPAAALYDIDSRTLLFTKTGNYKVRLKVGNAYGWKTSRTVWVTLPAVSEGSFGAEEEGGA